MRALILDDDEAFRQTVCKIVQSAGFEAILTTNAADFAGSLECAHPDVVILDLALTDTDGIKQLRFLKSVNYVNPVVLVSGFDKRVLTTTEAFARQLDLNVAGALLKPLRAFQLKDILARLKSESEPLTPMRVLAAARGDELMLEYQPVVTKRQGAVTQFEALVRWNHPQLGRLMPDKFIALAEQDSTVMDQLTDWVVTTAIRDYAGLRDLGVAVPIAVNVSSVNLHDTGFPDRLHARLSAARVPHDHFSIEITESAASLDPVRGLEILSRLRLNGVRLAIDDFGTGYSSLKQLQQMPFSTLKIDGSFVMSAMSSHDALVIVKAIVALAKAMELQCIAECVEDDETASLLEYLGVDAMQGYLIGRPMPAREILSWMIGRDVAEVV